MRDQLRILGPKLKSSSLMYTDPLWCSVSVGWGDKDCQLPTLGTLVNHKKGREFHFPCYSALPCLPPVLRSRPVLFKCECPTESSESRPERDNECFTLKTQKCQIPTRIWVLLAWACPLERWSVYSLNIPQNATPPTSSWILRSMK